MKQGRQVLSQPPQFQNRLKLSHRDAIAAKDKLEQRQAFVRLGSREALGLNLARAWRMM